MQPPRDDPAAGRHGPEETVDEPSHRDGRPCQDATTASPIAAPPDIITALAKYGDFKYVYHDRMDRANPMIEETPTCVNDPYDLILDEGIDEVYRLMVPCRNCEIADRF